MHMGLGTVYSGAAVDDTPMHHFTEIDEQSMNMDHDEDQPGFPIDSPPTEDEHVHPIVRHQASAGSVAPPNNPLLGPSSTAALPVDRWSTHSNMQEMEVMGSSEEAKANLSRTEDLASQKNALNLQLQAELKQKRHAEAVKDATMASMEKELIHAKEELALEVRRHEESRQLALKVKELVTKYAEEGGRVSQPVSNAIAAIDNRSHQPPPGMEHFMGFIEGDGALTFASQMKKIYEVLKPAPEE